MFFKRHLFYRICTFFKRYSFYRFCLFFKGIYSTGFACLQEKFILQFLHVFQEAFILSQVFQEAFIL